MRTPPPAGPKRLALLLILGACGCAGTTPIDPTGTGAGGALGGNTQTPGGAGTSGPGSSGSTGTGIAGSSGMAGTTGASGRGGNTGTAGATAGGSGTTGSGAAGTTGTAGRGGTTGAAGTGNAGRGGTTGAAGAAGRGGTTGTAGAGVAGTTGAGGAVIWPNDQSSANSDDWLIQNHDRISQLRPRVLAMDLANTANPMPAIQKHIDALANSTSFHKFNTASAQPAVVYQLLKVVPASSPNYTQWNSQAFADSNIQIKDPANPSGPNLTLCQLFEKGIINEVWCMATQSQTKCGESQETKVVYTNTDPPQKVSPLRIVGASNGDPVTGLNCKVSIRIIDFNTSRGTGCHQHALGHGWERYMDASAIPLLRKQAGRFLNWDLMARVAAPFNNFYSACSSNGSQLTDCIVWDSQIAVRSGPSAARTFNIPDMSGGCGNAHFYANTTGTYSYDARTPDPTVLSSCEHYGLHDGANGKDMTTTYTNAMTDTYANQQTGASDDDCGGHGTSYLYQNFPNYGTTAKNDDGTPMHNWWVYLFY
jgi:hypothetical protein